MHCNICNGTQRMEDPFSKQMVACNCTEPEIQVPRSALGVDVNELAAWLVEMERRHRSAIEEKKSDYQRGWESGAAAAYRYVVTVITGGAG